MRNYRDYEARHGIPRYRRQVTRWGDQVIVTKAGNVVQMRCADRIKCDKWIKIHKGDNAINFDKELTGEGPGEGATCMIRCPHCRRQMFFDYDYPFEAPTHESRQEECKAAIQDLKSFLSF